MNRRQIQTTAASLIGVAAGYAAGHGWLGLGVGDWTTVLTAAFGIVAIVWPPLATRAQALKDTVGRMERTTVVTDAESANALPHNPDVVAATPAIVSAIKASHQ